MQFDGIFAVYKKIEKNSLGKKIYKNYKVINFSKKKKKYDNYSMIIVVATGIFMSISSIVFANNIENNIKYQNLHLFLMINILALIVINIPEFCYEKYKQKNAEMFHKYVKCIDISILKADKILNICNIAHTIENIDIILSYAKKELDKKLVIYNHLKSIVSKMEAYAVSIIIALLSVKYFIDISIFDILNILTILAVIISFIEFMLYFFKRLVVYITKYEEFIHFFENYKLYIITNTNNNNKIKLKTNVERKNKYFIYKYIKKLG